MRKPDMNKDSTVLLGGALMFLALCFPQIALSQQAARHETELDRMIAAGTSQQQLAQYVFNTHGCKSCHTIGRDGKLGFTVRGKERAKGFEGCINMLTAMTVIVQVQESQRSSEQRTKAERFQEFGCTACHQVTPGKLSLTDTGSKLQHLHLGCVDIEKIVASRSSPDH